MNSRHNTNRKYEKQSNETVNPYESTEEGLFWNKQTSNGKVRVRLTNFPAKITADVVEDDGVETERRLELEARVEGKTVTFTIPASQFHAMTWATEHLGPKAIIYSGYGNKDQARVAIQSLSLDIQTKHVFTHTGWRNLQTDEWVYLHAGGAVGTVGTVPTVGVKLESGLSLYSLPDPPEGESLVEAIRASLAFLDVAPDRITVPLLAAVYRAVLQDSPFSLHLSGLTGTMKTTIAALAQQHFGKELDAAHLPGSWSSTANALEGLCFTAKDALVVVDDFCPMGSVYDQQRSHAQADRLLRAQGNQSGRQRMRSDATLRPSKPPRGLIISTGEDIPKGHSLRARLLILEVSPGDVAVPAVTQCQSAASMGLYAQGMAGFLQWIAGRYESLKEALDDKVRELRAEASEAQMHKRTPEIVAHLASGLHYFFQFACEREAITQDELKTLWSRCWTALLSVSQEQTIHHGAQDPVPRFFELLSAAVTSGLAHFVSVDGGIPENPESAGWKRISEETPNLAANYFPQGQRIGWVDDDYLYLQPDAAFGMAQRMGREAGEPVPISQATLWKRFKERGALLVDDTRDNRLKVRKVLEGQRREVIQIPLDPSIQKVDQVSQLYQPDAEEPDERSIDDEWEFGDETDEIY